MGIDPDRPLIVAGSTGPGEEKALIADRPVGAQLLLAPRRQERWDEVAALVPGMPRRSTASERSEIGGHDVFLLDTIGELAAAYALADAVFVGRSLVPMGGSNPIEPVALSKPTVIGPYHENFSGVVEDLASAGGIRVSERPMGVIADWLRHPEQARGISEGGLVALERHRGAAARMARQVLDFLPAPAAGSVVEQV